MGEVISEISLTDNDTILGGGEGGEGDEDVPYNL